MRRAVAPAAAPDPAPPDGPEVMYSLAWALAPDGRGAVADRLEAAARQHGVRLTVETHAATPSSIIVRRGAAHAVLSRSGGAWTADSTEGAGNAALTRLVGF